MHLTIHELIDWGTQAIAGSSVTLLALRKAEGLLEIWIPKADSLGNLINQKFWWFFDKLDLSLEYISVSTRRKDQPGLGPDTIRRVKDLLSKGDSKI